MAAAAVSHRLPILWSFRRCPYAIRARLALAAAGLQPGSHLEVREVDLACKPPELLALHPSGTVPVLQLPNGAVIAESLDIMRWALAQCDPQAWLLAPVPHAAATPKGTPPRTNPAAPFLHPHPSIHPAQSIQSCACAPCPPDQRLMPQPSGLPELPEVIADLIAANDGPFKHHLDRFKYATRHRGEDPQDHQRAALRILLDWNSRLRWGEALGDAGTSGIADAAVGHPWCAETPWLLGGRSCLADWALLPFVRQFRQADPQGLDSHPELGAVRAWLARFEAGPELALVMQAPWAERSPWPSRHWIYHLALDHEWQQARADGVYRQSSRGLSLKQVGFIHASYGHQIEATHARFFADAEGLRLLTIDPARLADAGIAVLEEEAAEGSGERFPHIYGPLPCSAVLSAKPYKP